MVVTIIYLHSRVRLITTLDNGHKATKWNLLKTACMDKDEDWNTEHLKLVHALIWICSKNNTVFTSSITTFWFQKILYLIQCPCQPGLHSTWIQLAQDLLAHQNTTVCKLFKTWLNMQTLECVLPLMQPTFLKDLAPSGKLYQRTRTKQSMKFLPSLTNIGSIKNQKTHGPRFTTIIISAAKLTLTTSTKLFWNVKQT